MATVIRNPARKEFPKSPLGGIVSISDGQTAPVVQVNGIENGAVLFKPPKALLDGASIYAGIPAKIPGLNANTVLSLDAKDKDGVAIFTAGLLGHAPLLLQNTIGIARTNENQTPHRTKHGWEDPLNYEATKHLAHNITRYEIGQAMGIGRGLVNLMELPDPAVYIPTYAEQEAQIGDLVMGGWEHADFFNQVVPVLKRSTETGVATDASGNATLANGWVVEIEYIDDQAGATVWDADAQLVPGLASTQQILGTSEISGLINITYRYFELGNLIPLNQMWKLVLGKIVSKKDQRVGIDMGRLV
jgi:hypothetical protein